MVEDRQAGTAAAARHIPVLGPRALAHLGIHSTGVYVDATFGAGGYTRAMLDAGAAQVIAIDRDPHALALGAELLAASKDRLTLIESQFSQLESVARQCGHDAIDGVVLDLGVSSMQLDSAARGFSFRLDGPLDMRMGTQGPSAADIVAQADERDLANIIFQLGEERHSRAVARAIVKARAEDVIETTRALADIVARVIRTRPHDIHPATRTFQALRIFVNDELGELIEALAAAERILKPGGRLVAVSFHSLEDRIVKSFMTQRAETRSGSRHAPEVVRAAPSFTLLTKRPETADEEEVARNPRARSAKLRAAERTVAPPHDADPSNFLPRLPSLSDIMKGH